MYKSALFANSLIAMRENRLLDANKVKKMIDAEDYTDCIKLLAELDYEVGANVLNVDLIIDSELKKTVDFMDEFCADFALLTVIYKKFDYHNAKAIAKEFYAKISSDDAVYSVGLIDKQELRRAIEYKSYNDLPEPMVNALMEIERLFAENNGSGRDVDVLLDCASFEDTSVFVKKIKNKSIREYYVAEADIANIMICARGRKIGLSLDDARKQLVTGGALSEDTILTLFSQTSEILEAFERTSYGELIGELCVRMDNDQSIYEFERMLAEYLFNLSRAQKDNLFTVEPLFAWYIQKLNEFKTIRLIIVCKKNNIAPNDILHRLRGIYA